MVEDEIIILKIGGSSITNKAKEETLNPDALDWFAKLIAASVDPSYLASDCTKDTEKGQDDDYKAGSNGNTKSKRRFIVVHGAGSFGHHSAKRYGLRCGKAAFLEEAEDDHEHHPGNTTKKRKITDSCNAQKHESNNNDNGVSLTAEETKKRRYQMEGLSKTRSSVQKLNAATVNCLIEHGINAVGISPGMSIPHLRAHGATGLPEGKAPHDFLHGDSPRGMQGLCESIKVALDAGLVPVVHGDACLLYDGVRAGILGGDTITEGLATLWNEEGMLCNTRKNKISGVVFITDVAGVFTSDPKSDNNAELIRTIKVDEDTGELTVESGKGNDEKTEKGGANLNVSGSSHAHDVTGGLKAKLGAAVTIVQNGIDVIISQCLSKSTERFVRGTWDSVLDVESGTLLSQQNRWIN